MRVHFNCHSNIYISIYLFYLVSHWEFRMFNKVCQNRRFVWWCLWKIKKNKKRNKKHDWISIQRKQLYCISFIHHSKYVVCSLSFNISRPKKDFVLFIQICLYILTLLHFDTYHMAVYSFFFFFSSSYFSHRLIRKFNWHCCCCGLSFLLAFLLLFS